MSSDKNAPPSSPGGGPPPLPQTEEQKSASDSDSVNYEILWDCEYCDTKKLLGITHRHCPNCGAKQNPNHRYFPPEGEEVVAVGHKFCGADKNCSACETPNSAAAKFCVNCGSPMDGSKSVESVHQRDVEAPAATSSSSKKGSAKIKFIVVGVVVFVLLIASVFLIKEERGVTVTGHQWERTIDIEVFASVAEDGWENEVPLKAYDKICREKQRSTKQVEDGESCYDENIDNGDGTFKKVEKCETNYKDVPVYDDHCDYKIDKWTTTRTEKSSGDDLNASWPTPSLKTCPGERLGCEREGSRSQSYSVLFKDDQGNDHACDYEDKKWKAIDNGSAWKMKFRKVTGGIDCDFDFNR